MKEDSTKLSWVYVCTTISLGPYNGHKFILNHKERQSLGSYDGCDSLGLRSYDVHDR